ncbi:plasminogen activator inhibitor 1 RNA-binding protein-like [Uloborus diversus]|uniref:plasminogen activator inhibitor 1 RNA-binding protein-like n=1 Tax=Uloborus diversus TaxID=327109 RepID=UPI0024092CF8|nr:plasminogen activator inhibitor 1 RNA-binding protein-like [Uloborus diversus]
MENAYGIGVKNRYELFYDEDVDPLEIIRQQEAEKEKRKTDKTHSKDKTKITKSGKPVAAGVPKKSKENAVVITAKPAENTETPNKTRARPFNDRTVKNTRNFEEPKDIEERKNLRNREEHQPANFESRDGERRGRGGFRGRGRPRGRGGFFNNFESRPPRREFDRHSGSEKSSVRPVEKREGGGSNNWGDVKNDFSNRKRESDTWMDDELDTPAEKMNDTWTDTLTLNDLPNTGKEERTPEKNTEDTITENMESKENEPGSEEHAIDESVREMTLDEWKREQEAKRAVPKYNLRKPGEGEDGNQWKKLFMLKKKVKEDEDDEEDDEEYVDEEEFARRGRQRQLVDIQINFNDSRRGRGRGRGVRGGGIGPRSGMMASKEIPREERREMGPGPGVGNRSFGRGSMKMNKSGHQSAPRVDDWNDFPSLVTA